MGLFGSIAGIFTSGQAAKSISDSNIAAEHGILDATSSGQAGINGSITGTQGRVQSALDQGNTAVNGQLAASSGAVNTALDNATTNVNQAGQNINTATGNANNTLAGVYNGIQSNLQPAIDSGTQGNRSLQDYAASPDSKFKFDYNDYKNDPAYQFELSQGANAITNQAAASGLQQGGNTLAALTQFGQGTAAKYYNDAFSRAQSGFQTNQNATLANLSELISSGATGNAQSSQAGQALGGKIAQNGIDAANSNATLQSYLGSLNTSGQTGLANLNVGGQTTLAGLNTSAQLGLGAQGLQGSEASANLGLQGSKIAGDYATGAGTAHAAGIVGTGAAYGGLVGDLAGFAAGIPGIGNVGLPGAGGSAGLDLGSLLGKLGG